MWNNCKWLLRINLRALCLIGIILLSWVFDKIRWKTLEGRVYPKICLFIPLNMHISNRGSFKRVTKLETISAWLPNLNFSIFLMYISVLKSWFTKPYYFPQRLDNYFSVKKWLHYSFDEGKVFVRTCECNRKRF